VDVDRPKNMDPIMLHGGLETTQPRDNRVGGLATTCYSASAIRDDHELAFAKLKCSRSVLSNVSSCMKLNRNVHERSRSWLTVTCADQHNPLAPGLALLA
jgi:hypothetical protein